MGGMGAFCKYCKHKLKDSEVKHEFIHKKNMKCDVEFTVHCNNCNRDLQSKEGEIEFRNIK